MSYMFYNCSSLTYLPDISKWNIKDKKIISRSFSLSSENSSFKINNSKSNKITSLNHEIEDNNSLFENNNIYFVKNNNDMDLFINEDNK